MYSSLSKNLASRAFSGKLTVEGIKLTTKEKLKEHMCGGLTVLYCASWRCPAEEVEAMLDIGVDSNGVPGEVRYWW
jgi:hypothetical protein